MNSNSSADEAVKEVLVIKSEEDGDSPKKINRDEPVKKQVSPLSSVLFLAGSIIGTGIFMSANVIVKSIPSIFGTLMVWVLCGVVSICAGLCYAELGLLYPSCGGEYLYFKNTYNDFAGFSFMFCNFLFIKPISIAILVLFTAESFVALASDQPSFWVSRFVSVAIVFLMMILHCCSNKWSIKVNDILTWSKFICMAIIIILSIYKLCLSEFENIKDWGFNAKVDAGQISVAIYNCMWSFDGFNSLAYMVDEMKNPEKNLLITSVIGLGLVTVLYVIVNFSYFIILGVGQLVITENVADAVSAPYLGKWKWVIVLLVALSALGSANATAYGGAKIYFAAAQEQNLPRILSSVHVKLETAIPSLFFQAIFTCFFLLVTSNIDGLLLYFSGASWVFYTAAIFAVVVLRHRKVERRPGFQVNYFVALFTALVSASFVVLGFVHDWANSLISVSIILVSLPVYYIFVFKKDNIFPPKFFSVFERTDNYIMAKCNLIYKSSGN